MSIIINADDFGLTKAVNSAIFNLAEIGSVSSTTVMVNMPYAGEVVKLINNSKIGIGLHFNLTQGKALSNPISIDTIVDENGFFFPKKELLQRLKDDKVKYNHIYTELVAQVDRIQELTNGKCDHIDSHQGTNKLPLVRKAIINIAPKVKIPAIRVYNKYYIYSKKKIMLIQKPSVFNLRYFGLRRYITELYWQKSARKLSSYYLHPHGLLLSRTHKSLDTFILLMSNNLLVNREITLEIACHPAENTLELQNTNMLEERVREYELLSSKEFTTNIKRYDLVSYLQLS